MKDWENPLSGFCLKNLIEDFYMYKCIKFLKQTNQKLIFKII